MKSYEIDINESEIREKIRKGIKQSHKPNNIKNCKVEEHINVVDIVAQIRAELGMQDSIPATINNIQHKEASIHEGMPNDESLTPIYRIGKKINNRLKRYSFLNPVLLKIRGAVPTNIKYRGENSIDNLIQGTDCEFVERAYNVLLNRAPDIEGRQASLENLKYLHGDRIYILGALRYSKEGKQNNVDVKGLKVKYYKKKIIKGIYKIPLIGYLCKWIITVITLPRKIECLYKGQYTTNTDMINEVGRIERQSQEQYRTIHSEVERLKLEQQELLKYIRQQEAQNEQSKNQLHTKLDTLQDRTSKIEKEIKNQLSSEIKTIKTYIDEVCIHKEPENEFNDIYLEFEDKFRGTREEIKDRLKRYLPIIEQIDLKNNHDQTTVMDIGCGRGEWLEILKENRFKYIGIDSNKRMIEFCDAHNLNVIDAEGIEYTKTLADESVHAITAIQVVEHMNIENLIVLLKECYRALKPGGAIILETPNPENMIVGACNFYFDPSHQRPIPPLQLYYLTEVIGYEKIEIVRQHKYGFIDDETMQKVPTELKTLVGLFNNEADYAIIAYKPAQKGD